MPQIEIKVKQDGGHKVYARGRNGYFSPTLVYVGRNENQTTISIQSQRFGNSYPVSLSLFNEDAEKLGAALLKKEDDPNFIGRFVQLDGEGEYRDEVFIKADNIEQAKEKLLYFLAHFWEETVEVEPGTYEEKYGWRRVKLQGIEEITDIRETALQCIMTI